MSANQMMSKTTGNIWYVRFDNGVTGDCTADLINGTIPFDSDIQMYVAPDDDECRWWVTLAALSNAVEVWCRESDTETSYFYGDPIADYMGIADELGRAEEAREIKEDAESEPPYKRGYWSVYDGYEHQRDYITYGNSIVHQGFDKEAALAAFESATTDEQMYREWDGEYCCGNRIRKGLVYGVQVEFDVFDIEDDGEEFDECLYMDERTFDIDDYRRVYDERHSSN